MQSWAQESETAQFSYEEFKAQNPLKAPETNSSTTPDHFAGGYMNRSWTILNKAHQKNIESSGIFSDIEAVEMAENAEVLFARGVYCLDLSLVPRTFKEAEQYEATILLKEIIDRIEIPPFDSVPDREAVRIDLEESKYPQLLEWKIPNTDIILSRVEGPFRQGEYLFSPQTVERLQEFYKKVKDLPYQQRDDVTPGFYNFYISTPGDLLPPKWNQMLPEWSTEMWLSQTI